MVRRFKDEKGSFTVEAVFYFPIFIAIFFLLISFGMWIYSKIVVVDAAREAARHVALGLGPAEEKAREVIQAGRLDVNRLKSVQVMDDGNYKKVSVTYEQQFLFPGALLLLGKDDVFDTTYDISETAVFKDERDG